MPSFDEPIPAPSTKMLYLGDSGAGKTGSIVALAAAGYEVRILDLDRGVEILQDFVTNPASPYLQDSIRELPNGKKETRWLGKDNLKSLASRISYVTITEDYTIKAGQPIPKGTAWKQLSNQLNDWTDGPRRFGNIATWGPNVVLVVDSLSRVASAAFDFQLVMNGRALAGPQQADYGKAQIDVERLLTMLYSDAVKCNVIVVAHINYIENEQKISKGFAQTIGKALSPKIGQYFNHALMARSSGQGAGAKRVIMTSTYGMVELKNTAPLRVQAEYPLATGLADYFSDVRKGAPVAPPIPAPAAKPGAPPAPAPATSSGAPAPTP